LQHKWWFYKKREKRNGTAESRSLEVMRAYEMFREKKKPRMFGGGGCQACIIEMFRNGNVD
jgi:hypothetical protein